MLLVPTDAPAEPIPPTASAKETVPAVKDGVMQPQARFAPANSHNMPLAPMLLMLTVCTDATTTAVVSIASVKAGVQQDRCGVTVTHPVAVLLPLIATEVSHAITALMAVVW